jgi:hypothetical protein
MVIRDPQIVTCHVIGSGAYPKFEVGRFWGILSRALLLGALALIFGIAPARGWVIGNVIDGTFSANLGIGFDNGVSRVAVQSDGKILVACTVES